MSKLTIVKNRPLKGVTSWPGVRSLSFWSLFGRYDYLSLSIGGIEKHSRISLLYGENGCGKTTILRLLYASLSPQSSQGLRSYIAETPFQKYSIELLDGSVIDVRKLDGNYGSYKYSIRGPRLTASIDVTANEDNEVVDVKVDTFFDRLSMLKLDILFLRDTRDVLSTYNIFGENQLILSKSIRGKYIKPSQSMEK